ncbi:hypothetical protein V7152_11110 [Neobacillus drentensis]|uniref:hypothetical protein n=1 Tax=Neobacillus drentensis TaxID=220684 RepID=UPI003000EDC1
MSEEIEYIGKKIKNLYSGIFKNPKSSIDEKYGYSILQKQLISIQTSEVTLCIYVGELFINSKKGIKITLLRL